jgi:hypothetical protein
MRCEAVVQEQLVSVLQYTSMVLVHMDRSAVHGVEGHTWVVDQRQHQQVVQCSSPMSVLNPSAAL